MSEMRTDIEAAKLGDASRYRQHVSKELLDAERAIRALIQRISEPVGRQNVQPDEDPPDRVVRALADHELLSLFAWTRDSNGNADMVINAEVSSRAAEHQELARRFAALRGETELVAMLAERVRSSH